VVWRYSQESGHRLDIVDREDMDRVWEWDTKGGEDMVVETLSGQMIVAEVMDLRTEATDGA
jgi:hypothetical protein